MLSSRKGNAELPSRMTPVHMPWAHRGTNPLSDWQQTAACQPFTAAGFSAQTLLSDSKLEDRRGKMGVKAIK